MECLIQVGAHDGVFKGSLTEKQRKSCGGEKKNTSEIDTHNLHTAVSTLFLPQLLTPKPFFSGPSLISFTVSASSSFCIPFPALF